MLNTFPLMIWPRSGGCSCHGDVMTTRGDAGAVTGAEVSPRPEEAAVSDPSARGTPGPALPSRPGRHLGGGTPGLAAPLGTREKRRRGAGRAVGPGRAAFTPAMVPGFAQRPPAALRCSPLRSAGRFPALDTGHRVPGQPRPGALRGLRESR